MRRSRAAAASRSRCCRAAAATRRRGRRRCSPDAPAAARRLQRPTGARRRPPSQGTRRDHDARRRAAARRQQRAAREGQPGNNAPFWRGVHDSGHAAGLREQPRPGESRRADPAVHAVPRLALHHRRRSLAAGAQLLDHSVRRRAAPVRRRWRWRSSTGRKGPIGGHGHDTGRMIERFTPFERAAHWANAIAFVVLAISGLVMAFGKFFLLPIIGGHAVRLADLRAEDRCTTSSARCSRCRW